MMMMMVKVTFHLRAHESREGFTADSLHSLFSVPNATGLDLSCMRFEIRGCRPTLLTALNETDSVVRQKLRVLKLSNVEGMGAALTTAILRLPCLQVLVAWRLALHDLDLSILPSQLNLTSLETVDYAIGGQSSFTVLATRAPNLRTVTLRQQGHETPLHHWTHPSLPLRHITQLTIEWTTVTLPFSPSQQQQQQMDMDAAMASFHALERLTLIDVRNIDRLLPSLVHCPNLRWLRIASHGGLWWATSPSIPSASVVSTLLNHSPFLHIELEFTNSDRDEWRQRVMELEELAQGHPRARITHTYTSTHIRS